MTVNGRARLVSSHIPAVTRAALAAVIPFAVLVLPAHATAWQCTLQSCPVQCDLPLTYAIGDLPLGVDEAEGISAIQRAFDDWNAPTCVDFEFEYVGRAADLAEPASMVVGVVPWSDQLGGANTWAIALTSWSFIGCAVPSTEPNIGLNGDDWSWSTDGTADFTTTIDLYSVVLDRIGFSLGIAKNSGGMLLDGISSEDEDAICWLYADGEVGPSNYAPPEVPDHCTPCQSSTDCSMGEVCLSLFGLKGRVCIQMCENDEQCPGDSECLPLGGDQVCLASEGATTCPRVDSGEDMGMSTPDLGTSEPDMGTTNDPDMSDQDGDMGTPTANTSTGDSGGCSTTAAMPFGPAFLLLLGFLARRRLA